MVCIVLRFPEALEYLEQGLALVDKLGDEKLAAYRWPGSQVIIEDTKPGKLLVIIFLSLNEIIFDITTAVHWQHLSTCDILCNLAHVKTVSTKDFFTVELEHLRWL